MAGMDMEAARSEEPLEQATGESAQKRDLCFDFVVCPLATVAALLWLCFCPWCCGCPFPEHSTPRVKGRSLRRTESLQRLLSKGNKKFGPTIGGLSLRRGALDCHKTRAARIDGGLKFTPKSGSFESIPTAGSGLTTGVHTGGLHTGELNPGGHGSMSGVNGALPGTTGELKSGGSGSMSGVGGALPGTCTVPARRGGGVHTGGIHTDDLNPGVYGLVSGVSGALPDSVAAGQQRASSVSAEVGGGMPVAEIAQAQQAQQGCNGLERPGLSL